MTKLEIPEGYAEGEWSFYNSNGFHALGSKEAGTIAHVLHKEGERGFPSEQSHKTAQLIALAPAMAEEIKRLREEVKNVVLDMENAFKECDGLRSAIEDYKGEIEVLQREKSSFLNEKEIQRNRADNLDSELESLRRSPATREDRAFQCLQGLLALGESCADPIGDSIYYADAMLSALSKPQGAQEPEKAELPSGCEPFDIERAKVEGARTAGGEIYKFLRIINGNSQMGEFYFVSKYGKTLTVDERGQAVGIPSKEFNLYCIAKPVTRRPFDLAAALRGEKVVTSTEKKVTGFRKRTDDAHDKELLPYEALVEGMWAWVSFNEEGWSSYPKLNLFMEGGV